MNRLTLTQRLARAERINRWLKLAAWLVALGVVLALCKLVEKL